MLDWLVPDAAARGRHLLSLLFTHWTVLGLGVALVAWLVARRMRDQAGREAVLLAASLAALVVLGSLPVTAALVVFALLFWAAVELPVRPIGTLAALALLVALVVAPVVWIDAIGGLGLRARELVTFATNVAWLRCWAYLLDRRRGTPRLAPRRFLLAIVFFPTVVNGPIEAPHAFARSWEEPALLPGLARVARGILKVVVIAFLFAPGWTGGLAFAGLESPLRLWGWAIALYAWFYLGFSGWSDVGIGLARCCGRVVPENFDRPWLARDPAEFWRRWHVSLGLWLRDYVYVPLGGGRRRRALNVAVTFLVSALWHVWGSVKLLGLGFFGPHAWDGFLLWGLLNAAGVLASRPIAAWHAPGGGRVAIARVATFLFAAWCWIPFFLPSGVSLETCLHMLTRMLWPFG
jgi:D-alanyl-lipoteichoic acid acyltransferase DltB (MBOAT superfamily)